MSFMERVITNGLRRSGGMDVISLAALFQHVPLQDVRRWLFDHPDKVYIGKDGLWALKPHI